MLAALFRGQVSERWSTAGDFRVPRSLVWCYPDGSFWILPIHLPPHPSRGHVSRPHSCYYPSPTSCTVTLSSASHRQQGDQASCGWPVTLVWVLAQEHTEFKGGNSEGPSVAQDSRIPGKSWKGEVKSLRSREMCFQESAQFPDLVGVLGPLFWAKAQHFRNWGGLVKTSTGEENRARAPALYPDPTPVSPRLPPLLCHSQLMHLAQVGTQPNWTN